MAVWEYKVISSGKGGFASPALLESFLNQLGTDEWEIVEFRGQPDNPLAFSGLARRPTQRDWTLGDAAAAAAKVEADKLREEFEAKFKSATASAAAPETTPEVAGPRRRAAARRTACAGSATPSATPTRTHPTPTRRGRVGQAGRGDELPTFFEAMRPHLRRNQRGPGFSAGVDYLAKKWDISEADVIGALKECGLEIPDDEDAKVQYVEYDGDLFWVNINRRGELWVNTKEKSRPVFRTVKAAVVEAPDDGAKGSEPQADAPHQEERKSRRRDREPAEPVSNEPAAPLPTGTVLLDKIRPMMRKNRHEPGGSGSMSFLSRGLRSSEAALIEAFVGMGLSPLAAPGDPPVFVQIGDETWWLNKDSRGGVWINARLTREEAPASPPSSSGSDSGPAPGNVFAAVRLLLKETKTGAVAAPVERLAGELGKSVDEFLGALTASGLRVPEKSREKPVFAEHAGEIFWLNLNGKGGLWLNAKASKYPDGDSGGRGRRSRKEDSGVHEPASEAPEESPPVETLPTPASDLGQGPPVD